MNYLMPGFLCAVLGSRLYFRPFMFQPKGKNLDEEVISDADRRYARYMKLIAIAMIVGGLIGMIVGVQEFFYGSD